MDREFPFFKVGDMVAVGGGDTAIVKRVLMLQPNVMRVEAWCEQQRRPWICVFDIVTQGANDASTDSY